MTAAVVIAAILIAPNIAAFSKTTNQIVVSEANSGQEVKLREGDQLLAVLDSNPSTGYSWGLTGNSAPDVLKNTGNEFTTAGSSTNPAPGAAGKEVWLFKGAAKGSSAIQLDYYRPAEKGISVEKTFKLSVVVE